MATRDDHPTLGHGRGVVKHSVRLVALCVALGSAVALIVARFSNPDDTELRVAIDHWPILGVFVAAAFAVAATGGE